MSKMTLCQVVFFLPLTQAYTYKVPSSLVSRIQVGARVVASLGSRRHWGMVVALGGEDREGLKEVEGLLDDEPLLPPSLLDLTRWASRYYLEPWGLYLKAALPPSLRQGKAPSLPKVKWVVWRGGGEGEPTSRQRELLGRLEPLGRVPLKVIISEWGFGNDVVVRLAAGGWVTLEEVEEEIPLSFALAPREDPLPLTPEQKGAYDKVVRSLGTFVPFLLHGVTGSGKTELYFQWGKLCLEQGKGLLVLIPEISLTPQYIRRFTARFGREVAVLHSGLTARERLQEWLRIREGRARVVLGTRSALFAPMDGLGLIVVDEEHDTSFKQEESPRYNARDLAVVRAQMEGCPVVLASATPSLESYYNALQGRYTLLELRERIGGTLPSVEIVDMTQEKGLFSRTFFESLKRALEAGSQALVLLNRRGYAPFLMCSACGEAVRCPNCDITLTFHRDPSVLKCHYCGHHQSPLDRCPRCQGEMRVLGVGIQRVEEELKSLFPDLKVARMDRDALRGRKAHWEVLRALEEKDVDLLLGTQMVAKGHHYPAISFVGVVLADVGLHLPDFRAAERTFQLLTQVVGRAGRGGQGQAVIQTYMPSHPAVVYAARQDFLGFVEEELERRKALGYPPFSHMARVLFTGTRKEKVEEAAWKIAEDLRQGAKGVEILGPASAPLARLKNRFRWHLILRGQSRKRLLALLAALPQRVGSVKVQIDMDPYGVL